MSHDESDELTDDALIAAIARGEHVAFSTLYDRHAGRVYSLAFTMLRDRERAEDAVQEVFVRIWRRADSYDVRAASVTTWLSRITHHYLVDELRRQRVRPAALVDAQDAKAPIAHMPAADSTEADALTAVFGDDVRSALADLPERQRAAIVLAYLGGRSHSEIATLLGAPLGSIKTSIFQGMKTLRLTLGVAEGEEVSR